jgi:membrane associated rhomboid family serine protease
VQTCYRHSDRETGVSCSNCGNPICTECMTSTPVGMRCPECSAQKTKVRTLQSLAVQPSAAYALIAVNVAIFVAQVIAAGGGRATRGEVYERGVLFGPFVETLGEWWRVVTGGFLHGDPLHLLLNMAGLYFLGQFLEPTLGHVRFVALYFASLLTGSFGALLLSFDSATVGASGAIFGLLGAAFVLMLRRGIDPFQTGLGAILILNLVITFAIPNISIGGHLGGLAGGALAALVIDVAERQRGRSTILAVLGCAAIGVVAFAGSLATGASG